MTSSIPFPAPRTEAGPDAEPDIRTRRWLGIRYGHLQHGQRFDRPVLETFERGLSTSTRFESANDVPVFPQLPSRLETFMGAPSKLLVQDEDAFFLNLFAPHTGAGLPVVIFIHGGAWVSGAGTFAWHDGSELARRGLCVASINYRIHATGHLSDSTEHRPLQDLETALEWVLQNIHHFGGDPANVTLVGQSAGGWYVHALARMQRLRGKFRKIALLSMGTRTPWSRDRHEEIRREISALNDNADLRTMPLNKLLVDSMTCSRIIAKRFQQAEMVGYTPAPLLPAVSKDLPIDVLDPGASADELIVDEIFFRYTTDETGIFMADSPTALQASDQQVRFAYSALISNPEHVPEHLHRRMVDTDVIPYERLRAITSWAQFQQLPTRLSQAYVAAGKYVELHEFDTPSTVDSLGACHCLDLPFQFGNLDAWREAPMLSGITREQFGQTSRKLIDQLSSFVLR
ncbi:alpha/beta fold hydrolase [Glutamicibacter mysorens]|uniref:alpha/beta fold hydrolase n=1 Tax=Glutamicibacter mysorens TaxID=257984 RepID=UPI0020C615B2|nr:alpha/beta fold hydrolase [Glutamicibacter mysorens]UTM47872.1 alpha/beta fold hydrolase [Glutamicibacter mysorens]